MNAPSHLFFWKSPSLVAPSRLVMPTPGPWTVDDVRYHVLRAMGYSNSSARHQQHVECKLLFYDVVPAPADAIDLEGNALVNPFQTYTVKRVPLDNRDPIFRMDDERGCLRETGGRHLDYCVRQAQKHAQRTVAYAPRWGRYNPYGRRLVGLHGQG